MKTIKHIFLVASLCFLSQTFAEGNTITIEANEIKGGGEELIITGSPDVITDSKYGKVYSDFSKIITQKGDVKSILYSGDVNFDLDEYQLIIRSNEMLDKGTGVYSFAKSLTIESYNKSDVSTFSCSNKTIVQDGITYHSPVKIKDSVSVACSASGTLEVTVAAI